MHPPRSSLLSLSLLLAILSHLHLTRASSSPHVDLQSWLASGSCSASDAANEGHFVESAVVSGECFSSGENALVYVCANETTIRVEHYSDKTCTNMTSRMEFTAGACNAVPDTDPPRSFRYECGEANVKTVSVLLLGALAAVALRLNKL
jgi:hypothetical protein